MTTALATIQPKTVKFEDVLQLVLDALPAAETRRKYKQQLMDFAAWAMTNNATFDRISVARYRTLLIKQGKKPPSVNQALTAIRKFAVQAALNGLLSEQCAFQVQQVPPVKQRGSHSGRWLTLKQAQALILAPDPRRGKGVRDRMILALMVGCGLRRSEVANVEFSQIEQREGRWVIVDLRGKGGRIRTIPMPRWVKYAIDQWAGAAQLHEGRVVRPMNTHDYLLDSDGPINGESLRRVVEYYGAMINLRLKPHDLRRTCAKLSRKSGGLLEQIQLMLGHASIVTTQRYLGTTQDLEEAPNDLIDLKWKT